MASSVKKAPSPAPANPSTPAPASAGAGAGGGGSGKGSGGGGPAYTGRYAQVPAAVQALTKAGFKPGDVVPHSWLDLHLGTALPSMGTKEDIVKAAFYRLGVVKAFREAVHSTLGLYLDNVLAQGYRIVPASETGATILGNLILSIKSKCGKAQQTMRLTPTAGFSASELRRHNDAISRADALRTIAVKEDALFRATEAQHAAANAKGAKSPSAGASPSQKSPRRP